MAIIDVHYQPTVPSCIEAPNLSLFDAEERRCTRSEDGLLRDKFGIKKY